MIGVISHIPEVAERLADRIEVVKTGATSRLRDPRVSPQQVAAESDADEVLVGAAPA